MGYCGQCGTELPASGKYCIKCGKPFTSAPQVEGGGQRKRSSQGNLEACILAAVAVYAVAAILGLLVGEIIGIIISVLLCVTLGFAYQKLKTLDYQMVQYLCLGAGIVSVLLVLVDLAMGSVGAALINVVAAIPLGYALYRLSSTE